ncbi:MAG TPA: hypothetical protein VLE51_02810 [Candidatus Saccharimonadales bacterium]|nr:hypothetical protein [Candidatus Saccharimonadales bacterium]
MSRSKNNLGFTVVETVLVLVIVGLVAFVGYKVYNTKNSTDQVASDTTSGSQLAAKNTSAAPTINSTSDLDKAQKALDQNGTPTADGSDLSTLNGELANF